MDFIVCNSEECSVVSSVLVITPSSELAWHGFAVKQMDQVPFLMMLGNDVCVCHAAPKSSSDNRTSRELSTRLSSLPVTAVETVPAPSAWKYNTNCSSQDSTKLVCIQKKQPKLKNLTQEQNCQSIHVQQGNRERDIEKVTTLYFC